jgi:hypothetical protein
MRQKIWLIAGVGLCLILGAVALAQTDSVPKSTGGTKAQSKTPPPPAQKPKQPDQGQAQAPQVAMPDAEKIVLLLRNTLIGLNDALQTGNFTVFRERSAPGFQSANSPERLAQAFADLAARRVDLSTVSVTTPQLSANPALDQAKGMLHLKGYFPLRPSPIAFEVLYQSVDGRWRLFGVSVQPAAPPPQAATRMPSPPPDQN